MKLKYVFELNYKLMTSHLDWFRHKNEFRALQGKIDGGLGVQTLWSSGLPL